MKQSRRPAMDKRLGRSLSDLLTAGQRPQPTPTAFSQPAPTQGNVVEIPVDSVYPNRHQPRRDFDPDAIQELVESIRTQGLLQPVLVRPDGSGRYELIAGERRLRAVQALGQPSIRAFLRDASEQDLVELALVENIQRADLNPIERARAFRALVNDHGLTHEQAAGRTGVSRVALTNLMRLLDLPEDIQELVQTNVLSAGHARALLGLQRPKAQRELAARAVREGLSVRAVEEAVNRLRTDPPPRPSSRSSRSDPLVRDLETRLARVYGTKVKLSRKGKGGKIVLEFFSADDLDRLLGLLTR